MITCPFCSKSMRATVPVNEQPAFRCTKCNVRIVITNQSYLPRKLQLDYWSLVKNQQLTSTY